MKHFLDCCLLLCFFLCATTTHAQESCCDKLRKAGIESYNKGNYTDAIKKWEAAKTCATKCVKDDLDSWIQKGNYKIEEENVWNVAKKANTKKAYQDYLKKYPKGKYADQARQKNKIITPPVNSKVQFLVDVENSYVKWKAYKVTGHHIGNVRLKNGNLQFEGSKIIGGMFEIDMTTITNEDLEGEYNNKLVGHLKSDDFFGVTRYPSARFMVTQVVETKTGQYSIKGNMTIKSTTKLISFNATVYNNGTGKIAKADIKINRADYDVRYGSSSFFDNLGDKTIYDNFDLSVMLKLIK